MIATAVFLPLLASLVAGICALIKLDENKTQNRLDKISQYITCAALLISAAISLYIFKIVALDGNIQNLHILNWIESGSLNVSWSLKIDTLTSIMLVVVTTVSSMVHIYSIGYMNHEPKIPRFMSYLSLFLGEILFIIYTKTVHGAPTNPIKSFVSLLILFDVMLIAL